MVSAILFPMSKKKKEKKDKKDKQEKQKKQKTDGNRLSKVSKKAASLGTALVGAVSAAGAQATIAKMVEQGAASERLDNVRHTIKEAAGALKNAAGAVHAALDDADTDVVEAATSLTGKAKDEVENTQALTGKVIKDAVDTLKDVADGAKASIKQGKKSAS